MAERQPQLQAARPLQAVSPQLIPADGVLIQLTTANPVPGIARVAGYGVFNNAWGDSKGV